ncbi:hypothetical protein GG344DRAFT_63631 [Lentinula edodes]|nr:hypothetical protein GG344DRAFT_63631 [Lentinula edodes]
MLSMRVSLNILLLLAISLPLLSTTSSALPISGDRAIEIRAESCPEGPQRRLPMKDRVKQTLSGCFVGGKIFLGYRILDMMLSWFYFYLFQCAVYAIKKKFVNAHKVIAGSVPQLLQKANQVLHQTSDPFTQETTILFHRMAGSPIGPMQMLIPPHYLEPPDCNGRGDLGISINYFLGSYSLTQDKGTEKLLTQTVEWDKWNILYWPEELKTSTV